MEKTNDNATNKNQKTLQWKALEYMDYKRSWKWFISVAVIFISLIGYSIYSGDWFTLAVAVVLIGFIYWYTRQKPKENLYNVTDLGLVVNERIYPYNEIHSFWFLLKPNFRQLNIVFNKKYLPSFSILIPENVDIVSLKSILGEHLPEQDNASETLIDFLVRLFKL